MNKQPEYFEGSVLTAAFNGWGNKIFDDGIRPHMFKESDHGAIFDAICHFSETKGGPIIPEEVLDYLAGQKFSLKFPDRVEQYYLAEYVPLEKLDYYIRQMLDADKKHRLQKEAARFTRETHQANGNLAPVAAAGVERLAETARIITSDLTDEDKFLLAQSADDEGNAQSVNHLFANQFLQCEALGWLFYNGKYWQRENAETVLDRAVVETLKRRRVLGVKIEDEKLVRATRPTAANVRNCKYLLKSIGYASISDFDNDPDLLNCDNGVVNLTTGELTPHNYKQRFTYCIETSYDPAADDSNWIQWLHSTVTPHGADDNGQYAGLVYWLQLATGYSLTGHTHEQCLFFLQGPPRAGKGLFLQLLNRILGRPLSSGVDFDTFTQKRKADNQNFDLAGLKSCRLVTASESERATMLNAKRVKAITGNDPVYCAHKGKDFFTYTPQYKIWLSSNFPIKAAADDAGLWSRLRIIHFPNSHEGKEDYSLESKLWKQRTAILKWAIDGAMEWYKRKSDNLGLGRPEIITTAVQAQRDDNDTVKQFIDDCCSVGPEQYAVGKTLTLEYQNWCKENALTPIGGRRLGETLRSKGFEYGVKRIKDVTKKCWLGIGLEI